MPARVILPREWARTASVDVERERDVASGRGCVKPSETNGLSSRVVSDCAARPRAARHNIAAVSSIS